MLLCNLLPSPFRQCHKIDALTKSIEQALVEIGGRHLAAALQSGLARDKSRRHQAACRGSLAP